MTVVLLPPSSLSPAVEGVQVKFDDWNALQLFQNQTAGYPVAFGQGVTNAVPIFQTLAATATGGMGISIGGSSGSPQAALIAGIICFAPSVQAFTVPAASTTKACTDLICVKYLPRQASVVSRQVEAADGSTSSENVPYNFAGIDYVYVAETRTGPSLVPTAPAGYQTFATISVPQNASSITQGDIAINFPSMNATGPEGPTGAKGSGATTNTASISLPAIGASVSFTVADPTAFPEASYGLVTGPLNQYAMFFLVAGVSGNTLTVTCLGYGLGATQGSFLDGFGTVTFTGAPGTAISTALTNINAVGTNTTIQCSNTSAFAYQSLGVILGPVDQYSFAFEVVSITGNTMTVTVLTIYKGTTSEQINIGALVTPQGELSLCEVSGSMVEVGQYKGGHVTDPGANGTRNVTFTTPFTNDYGIGFAPGADGFSPYYSNKTNNGFTINMPSAGGHGPTGWVAIGN